MVHGDDWTEGPLASVRDNTLEALREYGGQLIEIPYTQGITAGKLSDDFLRGGTTPDLRRSSLKRLIQAKSIVRIIETHSPLSALIAENIKHEKDGKIEEFDGFWSSSLTDSTIMGKPDIEALEISQRLGMINNIFDVTTKPLIMDADTGGKNEHFELNVRTMERLGISAVIIEDKTGLKKNSLFGNSVVQQQADCDEFCEKIKMAKKGLISDSFMIIARIESLILENGMKDALERAIKYREAGADGIMIHSRKKEPKEIFEFAEKYREVDNYTPLIAVPTSYNSTSEKELAKRGFNVIIYANHMLRAAYPAMSRVAKQILRDGQSSGVDDQIISIKEILELIPGTK